MKYLYYCNSAYQVLTILNLNWHRKYANFENIDDYNADIILLNASEDMKELATNIQKLNDFNNVFLANKVKNIGAFHRLKSIYDVVNPYHYIEKSGISSIKNFINHYDVLTFPKFSKLTSSIYKINKSAKLDLYEDGLGSYNDEVQLESRRSIYPYLYKILNYKSFCDFRYIYFNSLLLYNGCYRNVAKEIPNYDNGYITRINETFISSSLYKNKSILWLGQYLVDDVNEVTCNILQKYKNISIYKQHPRYPMKANGLEIATDKHAWEISVLNMEDINSKCLVTIYSTAALSPKILFDYEPYIIFTYKLLKEKLSNKTIDAVDCFVKTYKNKNKIMIPNTIDDFQKCVELFIQKSN